MLCSRQSTVTTKTRLPRHDLPCLDHRLRDILGPTPILNTGDDERFTVSLLNHLSSLVLMTSKIPSVPRKLIKMREDVVRRVNSTLQASFGKRYSVELFGSTVYGTDRADSDLDMALLVGQSSPFQMQQFSLFGQDSAKPQGLEPWAVQTRPDGSFERASNDGWLSYMYRTL